MLTLRIYDMTMESGEFEIRNPLVCITENRRLQARLMALAFGSFMKGTGGCGIPMAVSAAMVVGRRCRPALPHRRHRAGGL
jgi:lactate permease